MNKSGRRLGELVHHARQTKGLTAQGLAEASGTSRSFIMKLERGEYVQVSPAYLQALAEALDLPLADLYSAAGYPLPAGLPTFAPYLRRRYGEELPEKAISQLTEYFELLRDKYTDDNAAQGGAR